MPSRRVIRCSFALALAATSASHAQATFDCVAPAAPDISRATVLGDGTPGSVTSAAIQAALDAGGAIRLADGGAAIEVDATLAVTHDTVLDLGGSTLSGGGVRRIIEVSNPGNLVYTFVLQHGAFAHGATAQGSGAALYKATGGPWQTVTIRFFDVDFSDNHAIAAAPDDGGGAVYVVGAAELGIVASTFELNSGANGGALYSLGSKTVNLFDSVLAANGATGSGGNPGNGGNGGAIGVDGDARNVNLCRVRLIGNVANAFGGGLFTVTYSGESFTRIVDSTLQDNESSATDKLAGGAYIQGSPLFIGGSTFRDNAANGYAGLALFGDGGVLEGRIENSTFVGNVARGGLGGAISIQNATALTLQNVTIARNAAPCDVCFAAGIANDDGAHLTLRNVVFEDNVGGNLYNPWAILHPAAGGDANVQWPLERGGGQNENAASPGTTFAATHLADPADNGGFTETLAIDAASPAHDAGSAVDAPSTDQRGVARDALPDVGAYEFRATSDAIFTDGFEADH